MNAPLLLGTFTHENNSIPIPNLSAVDLDLSFDTNGIPSPVGALFDFERTGRCVCGVTASHSQ